MPFTLLPAVDVAGGRTGQVPDHGVAGGEANTEAASTDPVEAALTWQAGGAEWIHLVDMDAAFGRGSNADLLAAVIGALDVKVELAGGIVDDNSLTRALATGCTRVNLGSAALSNPTWCARVIADHGERVAISVDVKVIAREDRSNEYRVAARGGTADLGDLWGTLAWLDGEGCARYVVTDVNRDGMLRGPNVELYRKVAGATKAPVIASGGVSSLEDLVALAGVDLEGSVVGSALYANRFTLPEALVALG